MARHTGWRQKLFNSLAPVPPLTFGALDVPSSSCYRGNRPITIWQPCQRSSQSSTTTILPCPRASLLYVSHLAPTRPRPFFFFTHTAQAARDFLMQCFQKDPNLRVSARKLLRHAWIVGCRRAEAPVSKAPDNFNQAVEEVKQWNKALNSSEPALRSSTGSDTTGISSRFVGGTPGKGSMGLAKPRLGVEAFKTAEQAGMFCYFYNPGGHNILPISYTVYIEPSAFDVLG